MGKKVEAVTDFILGAPKSLQTVTAAMKLKDTCSLEPRQHIKKLKHNSAIKGPSSQSYGFSSSCVWMWEVDHKEVWVPKNWRFPMAMLEKTCESPLDCKEIKPVNPKGNQSWIFIGRTDAEAELQYFGHLMQCVNSLEKTWMLGKIAGRRKMGQQRMSWLDGISDLMYICLSKLQETVKNREAWHPAVHGVRKSWTWLTD